MFLFPHTYVALEKNAESDSKGIDYAEVDKRIMTVKDEVTISVLKTKIKSAKEKFNTKVAACTTKEKSLEKWIGSYMNEIDG